jgi:hypothetical protein
MLNVYTRLQAAAGVGIIAVCPGDVSTRMCSGKEFPMYTISFTMDLAKEVTFQKFSQT